MSKLTKIEEIKSNLRVATIWLVVWAIIAVYWLGYYTALMDKRSSLQIISGNKLPLQMKESSNEDNS